MSTPADCLVALAALAVISKPDPGKLLRIEAIVIQKICSFLDSTLKETHLFLALNRDDQPLPSGHPSLRERQSLVICRSRPCPSTLHQPPSMLGLQRKARESGEAEKRGQASHFSESAFARSTAAHCLDVGFHIYFVGG